ncbi:tyrosine-type recombinase/integrase [Effusibacillus consociatus]|uniref:Tyrosine-type recombinase/integrase n=1 Tax=Effusibacillus consociatus TaxID=1117041 RepID=A0ABV9Q1R9_9BACL
MSGHIVPFRREESPQSRRRSNTLYDPEMYHGSGTHLTWEEAVELYLRAKQSETASARTVEYERENLGAYKRLLQEQGIMAQITGVSVEAIRTHFVMYMAEHKKYALTTINNRIKTLKRFFSFLQREGWITENPTYHLKIRSGHKPVIPSFTEEQVVALLAQPDQQKFTGYRDYTMLALMIDTGLRLGEILRLRVPQVDLKRCFLTEVLGKSRRPRDVPFSDEVRKVLMKYIRIRGELATDILFVTIDGKPIRPRTFQQLLKDYGQEAGLTGVRISPHTLRHTFAKLYILNGGDPFSLQEILGHTTQDMVKVYVNLWKPEKKLQHTKASPMRHLYRYSKNSLSNSTD